MDSNRNRRPFAERAHRSGSQFGNQVRILIKRFAFYKRSRCKKTIFLDIILPLFCTFISLLTLRSLSTENQPTLLTLMPTINLFIFYWHFVSLTYGLVVDNTTGFRHLMQSMGLQQTSYYLSNFINMMLQLTPMALLVGWMIGTYTPSFGPLMIILAYMFYVINLVAIIFTLASLVRSNELLYVVFILAPMEEFVHYLRNYFLVKYIDRSSVFRQVVVYLSTVSPQESMRLLFCLSANETDQSKICENLFYVGFHAPSFGVILVIMMFWSLILTLFAIYFDFICPWQMYRSAKSPLFFLKNIKSSKSAKITNSEAPTMVSLGDIMQTCSRGAGNRRDDPFDTKDPQYFEQAPKSHLVGIEVEDIHKQFSGSSSPAVNNLSFNVYYGQTTLLLGHNGAGKTTLMNMITGNLEPTNGRVMINNNALNSKTTNTVNLGLCPQDSILSDYLTVEQHLELFLNIKLADGDKLSQITPADHIQSVLSDVGLLAERHKRPSELSGGMKRKLSLALAFVSDSKILILDEPSSGLDPESRRFVWDAIRRHKTSRAVLLSTQHMEEAEYLSDRVAIMSQGEIICCGSSSFLKKRFGCAYKLRIECESIQLMEPIMNLVRFYFPLANTMATTSDIGSSRASTPNNDGKLSGTSAHSGVDMQIELIVDDVDRTDETLDERLIHLLEKLELDSGSVGIKSFGLQCANIEDVLQNTIKFVARPSNATNAPTHPGDPTPSLDYHQREKEHNLNRVIASNDKVGGYYTRINIFNAFLVKHYHITKHRWLTIILARILLPGMILFAMCAVLHFDIIIYTKNGINLKIDTSTFPDAEFAQFIVLPLFLIFHVIFGVASEKVSKFKLVQFTSMNANQVYYWSSQCVADLITTSFIHTILFSVISEIEYIGGFNVETFNGFGGHIVFHFSLALLFIIFGICNCLLAYIVSCMNDSIQSACCWFFLIYELTPVTKLFITILRMISRQPLEWMDHILDCYNYVLPGNVFLKALGKFFQVTVINQTQDDKVGIYSWSLGFSKLLLHLSVMALIFAVILYVAETTNWLDQANIFNLISKFIKNQFRIVWHSNSAIEIDDDVQNERSRIESIINYDQNQDGSQVLLVHELTKSFDQRPVVNNLSFGVSRNECFGLLGINGAGKTTTFSMLMGDIERDSGYIVCNGINIDSGIQIYRQQLGFDPQHSYGLDMTSNEALYFMAKLRNIDPNHIDTVINAIVDLLDMRAHTNKMVKNLSGGTKRKLTLAIALIGLPSFVMLDEPTAGIDPIARRDIWSLLCKMKSNSQNLSGSSRSTSFLVSSHAMEECEAICDRLAIMIAGQMRCIGTFQHLREKFNQGYTIKIQFSDFIAMHEEEITRKITTIQTDLSEILGRTKVIFDNTTTGGAVFKVMDTKDITRSRLYRSMRDIRRKNLAKFTFLLSDSTLEDIFISMSKEH